MSAPSPVPHIKTQTSTPNIANIASPSIEAEADPSHAFPTTEDATTTTTSATYPDASLFTFLPDLYLIVSRLSELRNPPPTTAPTLSNGVSVPQTQTQTQTQASVTTQPDGSNSASANLTQVLTHDSQLSGSHSVRQSSSNEASNTIEVRELPAQIYEIRKGIAAAKEVVRGLPDVERGVEEQEVEIRELRQRVEGLKGRLGDLGAIAGRGRMGEDVVMEEG